LDGIEELREYRYSTSIFHSPIVTVIGTAILTLPQRQKIDRKGTWRVFPSGAGGDELPLDDWMST
jgi:hypothetical protein